MTTRKFVVTLEITCKAPADFLNWSVLSPESEALLDKFGPPACEGDLIVSCSCADCHWGEVDHLDVEPAE